MNSRSDFPGSNFSESNFSGPNFSEPIFSGPDGKDITAFCSRFTAPIRLCAVRASGYPLVCSLWYEYADGTFLCATQKTARIALCLHENPKCAFELSPNEPPYFGIRGSGDANITTAGAAELLQRLIQRYTGDMQSALARMLLDNAASEVMIKIRPKSIYSWDYTKRMRSE